MKYDKRWISQYELAKVSLNNVGNEIRSNERKSVEKLVSVGSKENFPASDLQSTSSS